MSTVQKYIDPNILVYLKENCRFVVAFCETYYWKRFNHFNLFYEEFLKMMREVELFDK